MSIIKVRRLFAAISCMLMPILSVAQNPDAVLGMWQSGHGSARIQIYKNADLYHGKLVWLKEELANGRPTLDVNNPDESLRSRPVIGMMVLEGFEYEEPGLWTGGTVYDPRSGTTYSCRLSMSSSDKLEVRAFRGISLIGKTQIWTRVE